MRLLNFHTNMVTLENDKNKIENSKTEISKISDEIKNHFKNMCGNVEEFGLALEFEDGMRIEMLIPYDKNFVWNKKDIPRLEEK